MIIGLEIADDGNHMGRLELPLPDIGHSLENRAKDVQEKIRAQTPEELKSSVKVKPFRKGDRTGLAIEYDDRAENFVYIAMEYPRGDRKDESVDPSRRKA